MTHDMVGGGSKAWLTFTDERFHTGDSRYIYAHFLC